jgi:hypothetical protein
MSEIDKTTIRELAEEYVKASYKIDDETGLLGPASLDTDPEAETELRGKIKEVLATAKDPETVTIEIATAITMVVREELSDDSACTGYGSIFLEEVRALGIEVTMEKLMEEASTEENLPEGIFLHSQEELEEWATHLRNKTTMGAAEKYLIFDTLARNPSPMTAQKALEVLKELSEKTGVRMTGSMTDMEIRFPDLKDFKGEIYLHSQKGEIIPSIIVYGTKDGKKTFELTCMTYDNGIFPVSRNEEQIQY